jgi:hypothetical protein
MRERYFQVLLTYARRLVFLPTWLLTAAYFFFMYVGYPPTTKAQRLGYLVCLLWMTAWSAAVVTTHVKAQLADVRASVIPRYRTPHLLLGILATLAVTIGCAALSLPRLQFAPAGVMALVLVASATSAWWGQLQNQAAAIAGNAIWLSILNRHVLFAVGAMLEGHNNALAAIMIALSGISFILLWVRQSHMHGGMGEYYRRFHPDAMWRIGVPTISDDWFGALLRPPIEGRCIAAANLWARVRHLRATGVGRLPWAMGAILAVTMLLLPVITGATQPMGAGALEGMLLMVMVLPPVIAIGHWARRWPSLGYESLRPVSRERFLRELGLAMALDLVEAWLVIMACTILPLTLWVPNLPRELLSSGFLPLSAAVAVIIFATNAWVLRLRSGPLSYAMMIVSAAWPLLPILLNDIGARRSTALSVATVLLAAAIFITLDAYARWRRTDLE